MQSFKKCLDDFIRLPGHSLFGICDKYGVKLLTKIRVSFSDLRNHRFNHNFNCESPLCQCGIEDETSVHCFLGCPLYTAQRSSLLCKISAIIGCDVTVLPDEHLFFILVYGSNVYNFVSNKLISTETITFFVIQDGSQFWKLFHELTPPPPPPPPFSYIAYHILPFFCNFRFSYHFIFYVTFLSFRLRCSQSPQGVFHIGIIVGCEYLLSSLCILISYK